MKTLKEILNELREIKKVLQTIASSLEREKSINLDKLAEGLAQSFSSRTLVKTP